MKSQLPDDQTLPTGRYEPPRFEVIPLDCEITAYEGDDDRPLF